MALVQLGSPVMQPQPDNPIATGLVTSHVLDTCRLLRDQLQDLEDLCAYTKARREEMKMLSSNMDKTLTSLRAQEQREKDLTFKLSKSWAKQNHVDISRAGIMSVISTFRARLEMTEGSSSAVLDTRNVDSDAQPYTANLHQERYRDSYTFAGPSFGIPPRPKIPDGGGRSYTSEDLANYFDNRQANAATTVSKMPHADYQLARQEPEAMATLTLWDGVELNKHSQEAPPSFNDVASLESSEKSSTTGILTDTVNVGSKRSNSSRKGKRTSVEIDTGEEGVFPDGRRRSKRIKLANDGPASGGSKLSRLASWKKTSKSQQRSSRRAR